jgi:hypothetical protein
VEAGYIVTDIDDFDEEFDGFGIRGSFEFVENWFLYAGYLDQSAEIFGVDVDATGFDVGFGYAFPLTDAMDLYGKLGYTEVEIEAFDESVDDDGYELSLGLRASVMEQLEPARELSTCLISATTRQLVYGALVFMPQPALDSKASWRRRQFLRLRRPLVWPVTSDVTGTARPVSGLLAGTADRAPVLTGRAVVPVVCRSELLPITAWRHRSCTKLRSLQSP